MSILIPSRSRIVGRAPTLDSPPMAMRRGVRLDLPVVALCLGVLLVYLPGLTWGLPSEYPMAVDSEAPYDALLFVGDYKNPLVADKYPAVIPLVSLVPYAAVMAVERVTGGLGSLTTRWPYGFKDPYSAFSAMLITRNLLSLAMGIGVLVVLTRLPLPGISTAQRYAAVALLATSGVFGYYARVSNPDVPYLFLWSMSFLFLVRYLYATIDGQGRRKHLVWAAVFSALAIGAKDQTAGLVLGSGILVLLLGARQPGRIRLAIKDAGLFSTVMLGAYFVVAILPQPIRWIEHVKRWAPSGHNVADYTQYPATFGGEIGLLGGSLHSLASDLSLATLIFAAIGLIFLVYRRQWTFLATLVVPVLAYYLLIIAPIRFVYEKFMLPVAFLTVIAAVIGIWSLVALLRRRWQVRPVWLASAAAGAVALFQFGSGFVPVTLGQLIDAKTQLSAQAPEVMPPGSTVMFLSSAAMRGLPNANFYRAYRMILPEGDIPPPRFEHIFAAYDPGYQFVLSIAPLGESRPDLRLVKTLTLPDDILDRAAAPLKQDYYIYQHVAH